MPIEIKNRYTGGVLHVVQADSLTGANFTGADLTGADLTWACLTRANFTGANFTGANFTWADLTGACFTGACFTGANFTRAVLTGADLTGACLRAFGDMKYLKTLQIEAWSIGYTHDTLQIGCQRHPIASWRAAKPEWLAAMSEAPSSAEWAGRLLPLVLAIIDASPALPPSAEVE